MKTGRVKFFKTERRFGFIVAEDGTDVFFHMNTGNRVLPAIPGMGGPIYQPRGTREPRVDDRLVYEEEKAPRHEGQRARMWAFEAEYLAALPQPSSSGDAARNGMPSPEELKAVVDGIFGIQMGIMSASDVLSLSNEQVAIFVRNTPDGKKGEELWKEFRRRQFDAGGDSEYTFITFVREALKEAGHPIPAYS